MAERSDDVPVPKRLQKVAVVYNLKKGIQSSAPDAEAEYDSLDTVAAVRDAIASGGYEAALMEADETLPQRLLKDRPDMVFNIAEGFSGRGREGQIPALLNMLSIPFTGSDETALCVSLDKAMTKRLLSTYRVLSPKSILTDRKGKILSRARLRFPVILKPNAEGSSKGIPDKCIAENPAEMRTLARSLAALYGESVLIEEYISGREFTVGILGNGEDTKVFPPMEILFHKKPGRYAVYNYTVKQDFPKYVTYRCPPELPAEQIAAMERAALTAFRALGCRDFTRVDFRLSEDGKLYFIELNPLPGLAPGYSDYPMLAGFCGVPYGELVLSVLRAGAKRCGFAL